MGDPAALAELARVEDLQQRALRVDDEIRRLLAPLKDRLSELVLERDRLFYEALAARQKFFQAARKAHPSLEEHGSLRFKKEGEKVYVVWDDSGPRFLAEAGAELPELHEFSSREPGRRADLLYWLR